MDTKAHRLAVQYSGFITDMSCSEARCEVKHFFDLKHIALF